MSGLFEAMCCLGFIGFQGFRVSGFRVYRVIGFRVSGLYGVRPWGGLGFRILETLNAERLYSTPGSFKGSFLPLCILIENPEP